MIRQQEPTVTQVLESMGTHTYLKDALRVFLSKDPVDAANDADLLALLMRQRVENFLLVLLAVIPLTTTAPKEIPLQEAGQLTAPVCVQYCLDGVPQ